MIGILRYYRDIYIITYAFSTGASYIRHLIAAGWAADEIIKASKGLIGSFGHCLGHADVCISIIPVTVLQSSAI